MKIILDTNVLVSAFISREGQSATLLGIVLTFPEIQLVLSEPILAEFKGVLSRPEVRERFRYSTRDIEQFVDALRGASKMVVPTSDFKVVGEDPKDDIVIDTAYDGKVDYIVSGDSHLQRLRRFRGIRIVKPRGMLDILIGRFGDFIVPEGELDNPRT
jgi:putative PIN family toxin of toxin-antitoxin system